MDKILKELRDSWKEVFKNKRLELVTSLSSNFLNYIEEFEITSVFTRPGLSERIYIKNKDHIVMVDFGQVFYIGEGRKSVVFSYYFKISQNEMRIFYHMLREINYQRQIEKIKEIEKENIWKQFQEDYKDKLIGKFYIHWEKPIIKIDEYELDLEDMYENYKDRKFEEKFQK